MLSILLNRAPCASMRPAQLTPENRLVGSGERGRARGFNEAGAINAGKLDESIDLVANMKSASMRPAQLTPENDPQPLDRPDPDAQLQ